MIQMTNRQMAKQRKKRREQEANGGESKSIWKRSASVRIDKDVDLNQIQSKLIKHCLTKYDSLYDKNDSSVYNFLFDDQLLFCLQDGFPLIPDTSVEGVTVDPDDELLFIPSVKAVYCCQDGRGEGRQAKLFDMLMSVSLDLACGFYVFTGPFEMKCQRKAIDSSRALITWITDGDIKPEDYEVRYEAQRKRFLSYGLNNATFEWAEITPRDGQMLYIPKTISDKQKTVYDSRIVTTC